MTTEKRVGSHNINIKTNAIIVVIAYVAILLAVLNFFRIEYYNAQHDVFYTYPTEEETVYEDHIHYIREIADNNRLPQTNDLQYYHPPLHHFICAMFLKVIEVFTSNVEIQYALLQIVPLIEYILLMIVISKLLDTLHIVGKYKILVFILLILHPSYFMLSRVLNNDMLVTLLMYTAIWRAFKWYQKPTVKNIILTGICAGLAVMTKISGGLVAIPILYLFIKRAISDYKKNENKKIIVKKYIGQTLLLGLTALPLGLWYPIRNYIKFNQSFFYVLNPTEIFNIENVGGRNLWERYGLDFTSNAITFRGRTSYNIPLAIIQTSIIGELGRDNSAGLVSIVLIMNMIAISFAIYCFCKTMFSKNTFKKSKTAKGTLTLLLVFNFISYLMMNNKLPYPCTMHYRYLLTTAFVGFAFIKYYLDYLRHKNKKQENIIYYTILFFAVTLYILAILAQ